MITIITCLWKFKTKQKPIMIRETAGIDHSRATYIVSMQFSLVDFSMSVKWASLDYKLWSYQVLFSDNCW